MHKRAVWRYYNSWDLGSCVMELSSLDMTLGKEHLPLNFEEPLRLGQSHRGLQNEQWLW